MSLAVSEPAAAPQTRLCAMTSADDVPVWRVSKERQPEEKELQPEEKKELQPEEKKELQPEEKRTTTRGKKNYNRREKKELQPEEKKER